METIKNITQVNFIKICFIVFLSSILLAISSKIKIPFYPVPMTMQTFVVLILGISLGWKIGLSAVFIYLLEGIFGLPVFSGTPEKGLGIAYFTGPTMGYLIGFMVTVFIAGKFKYSNNFFFNFLKLIFATSFIYILGIFWLGSLIGWEKPIFDLGVKPFLLAELFKILIATLILPKILKIRDFT